MKYWGYFAVKMLAIAGLAQAGWWGLNRVLPAPPTFFGYRMARLTQDLPWAFSILALTMVCAGLAWVAVWDQRRRCRVCLRLLRMPVTEGDWAAALFAPPETRSICPYGHGTLKEPEVHLTGVEPTQWERHEDDIWRELENLDSKR